MAMKMLRPAELDEARSKVSSKKKKRGARIRGSADFANPRPFERAPIIEGRVYVGPAQLELRPLTPPEGYLSRAMTAVELADRLRLTRAQAKRDGRAMKRRLEAHR